MIRHIVDGTVVGRYMTSPNVWTKMMQIAKSIGYKGDSLTVKGQTMRIEWDDNRVSYNPGSTVSEVTITFYQHYCTVRMYRLYRSETYERNIKDEWLAALCVLMQGFVDQGLYGVRTGVNVYGFVTIHYWRKDA